MAFPPNFKSLNWETLERTKIASDENQQVEDLRLEG